MYGFLHCALEDLVVKKYGVEAWQKIVNQCGIKLRGGSFLIHRVYSDELSMKLFESTRETLGVDLDKCLEEFGSHFLTYCSQNGFDQLLKALGSNLYDFLMNLDNLHDHLASLYPGMNAPSFRVNAVGEDLLHLHYYSSRKGLHPIVRGLVRAVALDLFDTPITIKAIEFSRQCEREHVILEIRPCQFLQGSKVRRRRQSITPLTLGVDISTSPDDLPLSVSTLATAFPFHFVINSNFVITQLGRGLARFVGHLWKEQKTEEGGVLFNSVFLNSRPIVECSFEAYQQLSNMVFVLRTKDGVLRYEEQADIKPCLRLKGQMIYMSESDSLLFLGSPRVADFDEMEQLGLHLSDFPLYDRTRDLLLMTHQRKGERALLQKLDETSNNLKVLEAKRREDKRRTEAVLASIFPPKVARCLCKDIPVDTEHFELVTCLYSDIVGFTAMCGNENVYPMDIVRLLNRLYIQFDALCNFHEVYKLETIGDAYIAVAGIPNYIEDHADRMVEMGLGMIGVTKHVHSPVDSQPIQIRIGIHTGPVIAGVVGVKMPRYCLFGSTVNITNLLETHSLPGRVTISEITKSHLRTGKFVFEDHPSSELLSVKSFLVSSLVDTDLTDYLRVVLPILNTSGGHFRSPTGSPATRVGGEGSRDLDGEEPRSPLSSESHNAELDVNSSRYFDAKSSSSSSSDECVRQRFQLSPTLNSEFGFFSEHASSPYHRRPSTLERYDSGEEIPDMCQSMVPTPLSITPTCVVHPASPSPTDDLPSPRTFFPSCPFKPDQSASSTKAPIMIFSPPQTTFCCSFSAKRRRRRGLSLDSSMSPLISSRYVTPRRSLPEEINGTCDCRLENIFGEMFGVSRSKPKKLSIAPQDVNFLLPVDQRKTDPTSLSSSKRDARQ